MRARPLRARPLRLADARMLTALLAPIASRWLRGNIGYSSRGNELLTIGRAVTNIGNGLGNELGKWLGDVMSKLSKAEADRRDFLKNAGKFAVIVPPTMTFLLSTTMSSPAIAASSSDNHCNSGRGNGDEGCDPGNSGDHNHGGDETTTNPGNGNPHG